MTKNPKPDDLPASIDDLPELTRPLVLDVYLSRQGVIDRIVAQTGISIDPSDGALTHLELAALYRHLDDPERRDPRTIRREQQKYAIIQDLAALYGFDAADDQDSLRKSQLVHILLSVATGTRPDRFTLPSDPDPNRQTSAVPVLGDA